VDGKYVAWDGWGERVRGHTQRESVPDEAKEGEGNSRGKQRGTAGSAQRGKHAGAAQIEKSYDSLGPYGGT